MSVPTQSFSSIRQNPKELYMQFTERLQDAMENQIANSNARSLLIVRLAQDNANEDCSKIIDALPEENPSLEDMINACAKVGTISHSMAMLANAMAAAMKPLHEETLRCYKCGWTARPHEGKLSILVHTTEDVSRTEGYE